MKIALLHPRYGENRSPGLPVGLAYITPPLLAAGHEVVPILMDLDVQLTADDVAAKIRDEGFDAIGVGALVTRYKFIKEVTQAVRRRNPDIPIIIGGKIADSIPEKLALNTPADILCFGEGEHLIVELMEALAGNRSLDSVAGICYRENGDLIKTAPRPPIKELDSIAFPAYDLFSIERYKQVYVPDWVKRLVPGASHPVGIKSSRGCPFVCTFCRRSFEPKHVRMRSVANVVEELRFLKNSYGFDSAIFNDELTLINKKRAFELADGMRKSKLNMKWHCLSRVDFIDRETIRELKSAGCTSIGFGIESGSQLILDEINKKVTVETAKRVLRLCDEEGMLVNCTYIIGMPSETAETVKETVDFIKETGAFGAIFFATAYPATALWDYAIRTGKISDEECYLDQLNDATDFVANFTNLSDQQLKALLTGAKEELRSFLLLEKIKSNPFGSPKWVLQAVRDTIKRRGVINTISLSAHLIGRTILQKGKVLFS